MPKQIRFTPPLNGGEIDVIIGTPDRTYRIFAKGVIDVTKPPGDRETARFIAQPVAGDGPLFFFAPCYTSVAEAHRENKVFTDVEISEDAQTVEGKIIRGLIKAGRAQIVA